MGCWLRSLEAHHLALEAATSVHVHFDWHLSRHLCLAVPCRPAPEFQLPEGPLASSDVEAPWQRQDDHRCSKVAGY